jgi:hypothetical protein
MRGRTNVIRSPLCNARAHTILLATKVTEPHKQAGKLLCSYDSLWLSVFAMSQRETSGVRGASH